MDRRCLTITSRRPDGEARQLPSSHLIHPRVSFDSSIIKVVARPKTFVTYSKAFLQHSQSQVITMLINDFRPYDRLVAKVLITVLAPLALAKKPLHRPRGLSANRNCTGDLS